MVADKFPMVWSTFLARYEGKCAICELPILVGQLVHGRSDGTYVHGACHDAVVTPAL